MNKDMNVHISALTEISVQALSNSSNSACGVKSQSQGCIVDGSPVKAAQRVSVGHRGAEPDCSSPSSSVLSMDSVSSASTLKSEEDENCRSPTEILKGMTALNTDDDASMKACGHFCHALSASTRQGPDSAEKKGSLRRTSSILRGNASAGNERTRSSNKVVFHPEDTVLDFEQQEADYEWVFSKPRIEVVNGQTIIYTETTQKAPTAASIPPSPMRQVPQQHQAPPSSSKGLDTMHSSPMKPQHPHLNNSYSSPMKPLAHHNVNRCIPPCDPGMVYSSPSGQHYYNEHQLQYMQHQHQTYPHQQFSPHMHQPHMQYQTVSPQMQYQQQFGNTRMQGGGVQLFTY